MSVQRKANAQLGNSALKKPAGRSANNHCIDDAVGMVSALFEKHCIDDAVGMVSALFEKRGLNV